MSKYRYHGTQAYVDAAIVRAVAAGVTAFAGGPYPDTPHVNAAAVIAACDAAEVARLYERLALLETAAASVVEDVGPFVPRSRRQSVERLADLLGYARSSALGR